MARSITFVIESDVLTEITITENDNGTLSFDINVLDGGLIGDLRALFFDLNGVTADESLSIFSGANVTDNEFDEEDVSNLGGGANINGSVVNELGEFDVGIEFGTSGISQDDIQSTSFTLAHDTIGLSLDMVDLADFGVRYTSVGEDGGPRNDSVKAGDQASGVAQNDALLVLENDVGSTDLLANDTNGSQKTVTGASDADGDFTIVAGGFERSVMINGLSLGTLFVGSDGIASFNADGADIDSLALGQTLTLDFSYQNTSPDGSLATADVTLTVEGINDAPAMANGTLAAEEDGALALLDLSALGSDIDNDDDGLSLVYTLLGAPSEGTASISGATLTFDPGTDFQDLNDGETRDVVLTVQATDQHGATATGTITVTITGETDNHLPIAIADMIVVTEDTPAVLDVLDNDTDADLDTLTVATINGATVGVGDVVNTDHGVLTVNANGTLSYEADEHYSGEDSFNYQASDSLETSNLATVSIDVEAVADAPTLTLNSATGGGDSTPVPTGPDTQINTTTNGTQTDPSVTALEGGGFVAAWNSFQSGVGYDSYFQLYDATGLSVGGETVIGGTAGFQRFPDMMALPGGGFIVAYTADSGSDPSNLGVYTQRYDANGIAVGVETLVNSTTASNQQLADIAPLDGGGYVVTWMSSDAGTLENIYAQAFDAAGIPDGPEVLVNNPPNPERDTYPAAAGLDGGGYVVSWSNWVSGSGQYESYAQIIDASGALDGPPIQLNAQTSSIATYSSVLALSDGGFVVVWTQSNPGENRKLVMSRFDPDGTLIEDEVEVSQVQPTIQHAPGITLLDDGGFLISWSALNAQDSSGGMFARRYDADSVAQSDEFLINDTVAGQQHPTTNAGNRVLTTLSDGTVVSVWGTDHGNGELFFRLVDIPATFDGVEGGVVEVLLDAALTDTDGSESLTIILSGFPAGTTFNLGAADGADWVIETAEAVDLSTLQMTMPDGFSGTFSLTAVARATEASNGDFAETSASVDLTIAAVPKPPLFTEGVDLINFGNPAAGSFGLVEAGTYEDGTQYDALGGDDQVFLSLTQADAVLAGYDLSQSFNLGAGDDFYRGSLLNDHATGGTGRDRMEGLDGNDTLLGEADNDNIFGGAGDDVMDGGVGRDIANFTQSGAGIDLDIGAGSATGNGSDTLTNFEVYAMSNQDDTVVGGADDDEIRLFAGNDQVDAGGGNDIIWSGEGTSVIDGGAGIDRISYQTRSDGVLVDLAAGTATGTGMSDALSGIEQIIGSSGDDDLSGDAAENDITGGGGDDILTGGGNADRFYHNGAADGVDTLADFDPAQDTVYLSGAASDYQYNPTTGSMLHITGGYGVIFANPATRPDAFSYTGTEIIFSGGGTYQSNGGALQAEAFNAMSVGTTGAARMISVAHDGTMAEFDFLANNGGYAYGSAMGDVNGDGLDDVVMSGDWSGAVIYYADGAGGYTNAGVTIAGQFQSNVEIADIDNDGDGDIYLQNGLGAAEVWQNDAGTFTSVFSYTNIGSSGSYRTSGDARFGDVDGDGAIDMLIIQQDNQNPISDKLFLGDGAGNFTDAGQVLPTASGYGTSVLADVNNDGALDYITGTSTGIFVSLNDGAGNFTSPVTDLGSPFNGDIEIADFNGDGFLDALRNDPDAGTGLEIWLGDGTDTFVFDSVISTGTPGYGGGVSIGDFSGDGIADVVLAANGGMTTLVNDGFGDFQEADMLALSGFIFGEDLGIA